MPIFEYECLSCGERGEYLVIGDEKVKHCKACGANTLRKLISPSARYTGIAAKALPDGNATGCCGHKVGQSGNCSGPGSCCGKL